MQQKIKTIKNEEHSHTIKKQYKLTCMYRFIKHKRLQDMLYMHVSCTGAHSYQICAYEFAEFLWNKRCVCTGWAKKPDCF